MDRNVKIQIINFFIDPYNSSSSSSSSSASSSASDDENNCIANGLEVQRHQRKKQRVQNIIETVINRYCDQEFRENYRMSRTTFQYLILLLRPYLEGSFIGRMTIAPEKQLYIALYFLGTPDSYRSVTTKFDVGKATAWRAVVRVIQALCRFRKHFICWPTQEEARQSFARNERRHGFPKVLGALDGTHVRIAAPKIDPQSYVNRKGVHSIQSQVICNDKLKFIHFFSGFPGSVHDMRVFKHSGVLQKCNQLHFPDNCHLIADSAYTIQKYMMVPFSDNGHLTESETIFNKKLSSSRMMVERSIGLLKSLWRILLDKLPLRKTELIPYCILACGILHNICLKAEDTFVYPIIVRESGDYPEPMEVTNTLRRGGINKRNDIKESFTVL